MSANVAVKELVHAMIFISLEKPTQYLKDTHMVHVNFASVMKFVKIR
jgi:hypothetical protein